MAKLQERAAEYHKQFADNIIRALREGTTPWQWPWTWRQPRNFSSGHDYHGGNAVYLAMMALSSGYVDPRWGSALQIRSAGGNVRRGEKGSLIWYWQKRWLKLAHDDRGNTILDEDGNPKAEWIDRPFAALHTIFNVEQTERLRLRPLPAAPPKWKGHRRAEALIRNSHIRVDHVAGDRAYYDPSMDRVVLPKQSQFASQAAYTHTALHELGHATGHPSRLKRADPDKPRGIWISDVRQGGTKGGDRCNDDR